MINVELKYNPVYGPLFGNRSRFLILRGGAGSGKSHFIVQMILTRILTERHVRHLVYGLRKTQPDVRASVFALFLLYIEKMGIQDLVKVRRQEMEIEFPLGAMIKCRGLDQVEKLKSVEGVTIFWMEEATEFLFNDFKQLNLRLRGDDEIARQIILSFNPIDESSWIKRQLYDVYGLDPAPGEPRIVTRSAAVDVPGYGRATRQITALTTTHRDNRFLDIEYRAEIESLIEVDEQFYRIYALGEWGSLQNLILTNWQVHEFPQNPNYFTALADGLDFGFNHPTALLRLGMRDGELYIWQELYERGWTNADLIAELKTMHFHPREVMYADSAEPARILDIKREGLRIEAAEKGAGSVKAGIDYLRTVKIHVHPSCTNTVNELRTWKYKQDKADNVKEEPVEMGSKHHFDAMAALRYGTQPFRGKRFTGKPDYTAALKSRLSGTGRGY